MLVVGLGSRSGIIWKAAVAPAAAGPHRRDGCTV